MRHGARDQRAASSLPRLILVKLYLMIIAATLTSSSTLLGQPLEV